jgi:hypothetical protein
VPVKRRRPKARIAGFPDWQVRFLETGEIPPDDDDALNPFELTDWKHHTACRVDPVLPAWQTCRERIMEKWPVQHPGCRPFAWWEFNAPEQRQRVGGMGTPAHEVLAHRPVFRFGIPTLWVTRFDTEYYNDFAGVAVDPDDPPLFESQATYLQRLNLLVKAERSALRRADFDPEPLPREYWPTR